MEVEYVVAHGLASSLGGMHVVLGFAHVVMLTGDNQQSAGRIAREVADVTLNESDLFSLVRLRKLSMELIDRLDTSIRAIMLWNSGLLSLGIGGATTPQTSSLLHNTSTVALGAHDTRAYLPA